jgi:nucleotide-binding universal stress UspA family protein
MNTTAVQSAPGLSAIIFRHPVRPVTRVIVGVDGSGGSAAALQWAAAEACRRQVPLRIVSAWEEPYRSASPVAGDPARIAAERVQKALARVLSQQSFPHRIGCAALRGCPGEALLNEAGDTGLLVLGMVGADLASRPGPIARHCLKHGHGPLVFVPARPTP